MSLSHFGGIVSDTMTSWHSLWLYFLHLLFQQQLCNLHVIFTGHFCEEFIVHLLFFLLLQLICTYKNKISTFSESTRSLQNKTNVIYNTQTYPQYNKDLPTSIQQGGCMWHFCLCFRFMAIHSGTSTGIVGLKGPRSPWKVRITVILFLNTNVVVNVLRLRRGYRRVWTSP